MCPSSLDQARILAASALHSGDWLHAIPSSNCGLLLENKELRIAVGLRISASLCLSHECVCGGMVDALGHHCFVCKKGAGKQIRHSLMNDVIWRSFLKAKVQAQKEPTALSKPIAEGQAISHKRPDGASIIPWKRARNVAWDMTVADTFAASYLPHMSVLAGAAAERKRNSRTQNMITSLKIISLCPWPARYLVYGTQKPSIFCRIWEAALR